MKRLFVSDLHIGNENSKYKKFLNILSLEAYSEIYLVGDIFDLWEKDFESIKKDHNDFFILLNYIITVYKTKVFYIIGNHDREIDITKDRIFSRINTAISIDLKNTKVFHGHQFDYLICNYSVWYKLYLWITQKTGLRFNVDISSKKKSKYFNLLLSDIKNQAIKNNPNVKTIIMGHTHSPEHIIIDDFQYINLGDWVEHLSYVVEKDGQFSLKIL